MTREEQFLRNTCRKLFTMLNNMDVLVELGGERDTQYKPYLPRRSMCIHIKVSASSVLLRHMEAAWEVIDALLHEMGHWIAATPKNRRKRNYGLRNGNYSHPAMLQEYKAQIIENYLGRYLGIQDKVNSDLPGRHNCIDSKRAYEWWEEEGGAEEVRETVYALLLKEGR